MNDMRSTFRVLFYLKRNAQRRNGEMPIVARITVNGKIAQFSTKLDVHPDFWDLKTGKVSGRTRESLKMNGLLDEISASVHKIYHEMLRRDSNVTSEKVKNEFLGVSENQETLLSLFQKHNDDVLKLVGITNSKALFQKMNVTKKHVTGFLKTKYKLSDISFKEIDYR